MPQLGQKADQICNSAIEKFSAEAPLPDDDKQNEALYDRKIEDLEKVRELDSCSSIHACMHSYTHVCLTSRYTCMQCLDAPLHVVYLKQLSLLRDKTLKNFKTALAATEGTEFDAMMQADDFFRREAEGEY